MKTSLVAALLLLSGGQAFRQVPIGDDCHGRLSDSMNVFAADGTLPTVDLGYARHKAVSNPNNKLYKFQNIRYAAPPTRSLRFKAPQPPLNAPSGVVEDGSGRKECLQAMINLERELS